MIAMLTYHNQHDGEALDDCITPPNCLKLDKLYQRTQTQRTARPKNMANSPEVHIHLGGPDSPLAPLTVNTEAAGERRKRGREELSDESDSDDEDAIPITGVLQELHGRMPDLDFRKYKAALKRQGIAYARSVLDFDKDYLKEKIGMPDGAVGEFLRGVKKIVKGKGKQAKRARVQGDENSLPQ